MWNKLPKGCRFVDEELDRRLHSPAQGLSQTAVEHLRTCPRCRELYRLIAADLEDVDVSPEIRGKIQSALTSSLKKVEPLPSNAVAALQFVLIFTVSALALIGMTAKAGFHAMDGTQVIAITTTLAAGAILLSLSLAWQMVPGSYHRIPVQRILTGSFLALLTAVAIFFPWRASTVSLLQGWPCSLTELAIGIPAGVLFWILVSRGAPTSGPALGAASGGIGGLLAVTVLQFQCPHQQAPHLLVWHMDILAILIPAGMSLGRFVHNRTAF